MVISPLRRWASDLLARPDGNDIAGRLEQASERASFLVRASRTVSGSLHTDRALDLILELLAPHVVDWAQIVIKDGPVLRCRALLGGGEVETAELPLSRLDRHPGLRRCLQLGVADLVMVPDGSATEEALSSVVPAEAVRRTVSGIRPVDLLVVPLTARGGTFGTLTLARRGGDGFDETAVEFLEDLTSRMSATIDATRVLAESRRVATVLSRDLNPPSLPEWDGVRLASYYRVAFEHEALGGDFYDVHGDSEDWTAVVGDVCGKGVEAAVLTGRVRQAVRTAALVDRDPAAVLDLVNRVLVSEGEGTFVTAVCARGRREGDRLRIDIAAAGHPHPQVVHTDGTVSQVEAGGTVLGLFEDIGYASVTVHLTPGETLLLYTDGVLEAPGHEERFGEDRLHDVLTGCAGAEAAAVVETVAVALSTHLGDRPHDDIAILALQAIDPAE